MELAMGVGRLAFFLTLWFVMGMYLIPTFFKKAKDLFKFIKSKFVKNNKDKDFVKNNKDYGNELFDKDEVNKYYKLDK